MINHARTLLLNSRRAQGDDTAEYMPDAYVPVPLPVELVTVRRILYGNTPDARKLNYRLFQFMQLLHASELESTVLMFDSRVTYLPFHNRLFQNASRIQSRIVRGTTDLLPGGEILTEDDGGMRHDWLVTAEDGVTLSITQNTPRRRLTTATLTFADGLSLPVLIPGTKATLQLRPPNPGDTWHLTGMASPLYDLAEITFQLAQLPQEIINWLFRDQENAHVLLFQDFWLQPTTPAKLAGLLCAVIWQTELLRRRSD